MRISTSMMHDTSLATMMRRQSELLQTQQQLSTGRRILRPADDPVGASHALATRDAQAQLDIYARNQDTARSVLGLAESRVAQAGSALQNVRETLIQAGNGTLSDVERRFLADALRAAHAELLSAANAVDGQGRALFAGYQDGSAPFSQTAGGVVYNGDQGGRSLAVSAARALPVSASGEAVFGQGRSGNGVFRVDVASANTGSGAASTGRVYDATLLTGNAYEIVFNVVGSTTTYDVINTTLGATVSSGNAWASADAIRVDGLEFSVTGAPAAGDRHRLTPSTAKSAFRVLEEAIAAIDTPQDSVAARAAYATQLGTILLEVDSALDRVLVARAGFGASLQELDAHAASNSAAQVEAAARLSALEDLDYAKALSDLERQKLGLEAAQKTHVLTTGLSLFDYLG